ncbi:hypothetical protein CERZMDRAFT_87544 [Cercospora zeae-maydis SCOH1-5]|uniref:Uncharacterized protein n=1 Tax=Cercospora zeae-maydis SCOH1-5 TaxID=717836 RepID=A0A6A6F856_9PEZI|nr:hypothetical protein CERZMDRAFT_87544 [Cercospora zeae-maydis SCOH1-5]
MYVVAPWVGLLVALACALCCCCVVAVLLGRAPATTRLTAFSSHSRRFPYRSSIRILDSGCTSPTNDTLHRGQCPAAAVPRMLESAAAAAEMVPGSLTSPQCVCRIGSSLSRRHRGAESPPRYNAVLMRRIDSSAPRPPVAQTARNGSGAHFLVESCTDMLGPRSATEPTRASILHSDAMSYALDKKFASECSTGHVA